jgi:AcrR family transcriptional regulator
VAGVAEGTLFTYFKTKGILMNELYWELKKDFSKVVLTGFPTDGDVRRRLQHIWNSYVRWGVSNPDKIKVLAQLRHSEKITDESMMIGNEPFVEVEKLRQECFEKRLMREYPSSFIEAIMVSLAETTIGFILKDRDSKEDYCEEGFEAFWSSVMRA